MKSDIKTYQYNGRYYTCSQYAKLLHKGTGLNIGTIQKRIRKGWAIEKILLPDLVKRPICKYNLDGEFLQAYDSVSDAIRAIRKSIKSSIQKSASKEKDAKGQDRTAGGFIWRYADEIKDTSIKLNIYSE